MNKIAEKYKSEDLGDHWKVDETKSSFIKLLNHLCISSNNYQFFNEAISNYLLFDKTKDIIVADLGAGIGWTSAILALDPRIKKIYVVDPSKNRLKIAPYVAKHFSSDSKKLVYIEGSFSNFHLPEKVDLFLLNGAFHHCDYIDMKALFLNIKLYLKINIKFSYYNFQSKKVDVYSKSKILISCEHHLNKYIHLWRLFKKVFFKYDNKKKISDYNIWSSEHNRFKKEIINIFKENKLSYNFFYFNGDMIDPMLINKSKFKKFLYFYNIQALYYYYSILEFNE